MGSHVLTGGTTMHHVQWIYVLLAIGATARLTRLVTADFISQPIRDWVMGRFGTDAKISYWITCDWCASITTGAAVITAMHYWWEYAAMQIVALVLTASHITGMLTRLEPPVSDE